MKYTLEQAEALTLKTGEFTKANATIAQECAEQIWKALPKTKAAQFVGELNELLLFIAAAEKAAPDND